ncbi:MAG TPA: hypothetical protein VMB25_26565 [Bryobacteraceae bacterium]|nr:hypothetical protein [Bryobacteraceae bacterium]
MRLTLTLAATLAFGAMGLLGASLTGTISDSMCGATHPSGVPAKQCTLGCVKKGAKYVLVSDGKVYQISNQKNPGLMKYAGNSVKVSGKVAGDSITISKIAPAS